MGRYLSIFALHTRSLFLRRKVEGELKQELQLHIDELSAEFQAQGMNAREAELAALRLIPGR